MSLTVGNGPFARHAAGTWNFERQGPAHVLLWDPHPRRLRAVLGDRVVADSVDAYLLHETGLLPVAYFPESDLEMAYLKASDHSSHCPFKGDAQYFSVEVPGREVSNGVWTYPEPLPGAPSIAGYYAFYADKMDRWFEEDEEIIGHLRDPYHRVDVRRSSRWVQVRAGERLLAESRRPRVVYETGSRPMFYVPREDVRVALTHSTHRSVCPYKGMATYWSSKTEEGPQDNIAWSYERPLEGCGGLAGYVCFDTERSEVIVDEKPQA